METGRNFEQGEVSQCTFMRSNYPIICGSWGIRDHPFPNKVHLVWTGKYSRSTSPARNCGCMHVPWKMSSMYHASKKPWPAINMVTERLVQRIASPIIIALDYRLPDHYNKSTRSLSAPDINGQCSLVTHNKRCIRLAVRGPIGRVRIAVVELDHPGTNLLSLNQYFFPN